MNRFLFAAAAAALLSGCASSSILVGNARTPIDPDQVRVLVDPPVKYDKIAILDAGSRNSWALTDQGKTNKVVQRLKKEAAKLGANGILLSGVGDQQIGSVGSGQAWGYGNTAYGFGIQSGVFQKKGQGLAIYVYPDQTPVAAPAAVPVQPVQITQAVPVRAAQSQAISTEPVPTQPASAQAMPVQPPSTQPAQTQPTTPQGQSDQSWIKWRRP